MKGFSLSLRKRNKEWVKKTQNKTQNMIGAGNLLNRRREIVTKVLRQKLNKPGKKKYQRNLLIIHLNVHQIFLGVMRRIN